MTHALVLSGGSGIRLGSIIPKQYMEVNGRCVISYCLDTLLCSEYIDTIRIVACRQWHGVITDCLKKYDATGKFRGFSKPGENRQLSIFYGLNDIMEYADVSDMVFIHDAARPMLSESMIKSCVSAIKGHDGTLPILAMKDAVYLSEDGKAVSSLLDRGKVYAGQAPEVFLLGKYYEANKVLLPEKILEINGSTEPAVMAGMDIAMIPGDEKNFKITTTADLERFREIVQKGGYMI
ncbi:MAG: 2-C-methyl-D-erythritol 4-phosphate cytidylyltransferase [Lachnospiraceae bacterium]|nr:2-C-methyl-D-erythritol 4-phosphate cytidylyltransferase [Lachnospiraceae bacterium]